MYITNGDSSISYIIARFKLYFSDPNEISPTEAAASNFSESQTASVSKELSPQTRSDYENALRTDTAEQPASAAPSEIHKSSNDVKEKSAEETTGHDNSKFVHTVNNADSTTNDT